MKLEERPLAQAKGCILVHNIAYPSGRKALKKGLVLDETHLTVLQSLDYRQVMVAVLEPDDVPENTAAQQIAEALSRPHLQASRAAGGRINFQVASNGVLRVQASALRQLNQLPGITLATRPSLTVLGPDQPSSQAATLKIIPYAVPQRQIAEAIQLAQNEPAILQFEPIPTGQTAALLLIGNSDIHPKLRDGFSPATRTRLERLGAKLTQIETINLHYQNISQMVRQLIENVDLLIIAGQTSVMDVDDIIPAALIQAGANISAYGAPVEPGNLMALAYFDGSPPKPVLCAPGCARSLKLNVVDMILPRLLLGEYLSQADIAELGLGGLLSKVWF